MSLRPGIVRMVRCGSCHAPFAPVDGLRRTDQPECAQCREWRTGLPHRSDPPAPLAFEPRRIGGRSAC